MFKRIAWMWFGEDFFLSYARSDGIAYAAALANTLGALGFSCFLDQWQPIAGREIPPSIRRSLGRASSLIVIASPGAAASEAVAIEIGTFQRSRRPMIPISFGPRLPASSSFAALSGIAWSTELADALRDGKPGAVVVERIRNTFQSRKRNPRIRWPLTVFALGSLALAGASGWLALLAKNTQRELSASNVLAKITQRELSASNVSLRAQELVAQKNIERATVAAQAAEERRKIAEIATLARDSALVSRDKATRELSVSLDLVENRTVQLELDRSDVSPNSRRVLIGLLTLIRDSGYAGELRLSAHVASFCVTESQEGAPLDYAPGTLPISQCKFWPASSEYSLALSRRFANTLKEIATNLGIDASRLTISSYGREKPRLPYPESGSAEDWNVVARQNNRVEITLVSPASGGRRKTG